MNWLALLLLGTAGALVTAACLAFLFVRGRLHRRHRVDPAIPTDAPASWMADPRGPARIHRRLVRIGNATTAIEDDHRPRTRRLRRAEEPGPLHTAAVELRARAVALDGQLARVSLLAPAARRDSLRTIDQETTHLERACAQLVEMSASTLGPTDLRDDPAAGSVTRRIDHLAAAHRELLALDDDAGLAPERTTVLPSEDRPTEVLPTPPPPKPRRSLG